MEQESFTFNRKNSDLSDKKLSNLSRSSQIRGNLNSITSFNNNKNQLSDSKNNLEKTDLIKGKDNIIMKPNNNDNFAKTYDKLIKNQELSFM